jgi:hypothetical protein
MFREILIGFVRMTGPDIYRSKAARIFSTIYFVLTAIAFLAIAIGDPKESQIPIGIAVFSLIGIYRSVQCGYLAIYNDKLIVRTLVRKRTFDLREIHSVEVATYVQFTTRVRPVLFLRNGHRYNISEFFMQKRLFDRDPNDNKVSYVVRALRAALQ